eukprot:COSAG02_NODE_163_length_32424_cov_21.759010_7_plen_466_part_00
MAFGDVALTIALLRLALPAVTICVGLPITVAALRHQPGRRLTRAVGACYALTSGSAILAAAQLLVDGGARWGGAMVADVLNGAAGVVLLLAAQSGWALAACVARSTPWSSGSGTGRAWRRLVDGRGRCPTIVFSVALTLTLLSSVLAVLWPVLTQGARAPSLKLVIYLSMPGMVALLLSLMLAAEGGLDPLGPTLSFALAPAMAITAAVIEVTEPPLPQQFDADALAITLLLVGIVGSSVGVHAFAVKKRSRRGSLNDGLLGGTGADVGQEQQGTGGADGSSGVAARAELAAALGRIRRGSLVEVMLGGLQPSAARDPEAEWEAAAKRQKFAATLLWFVVCFGAGLPGVALGRFVQFDLRADPSIQAIFGVIGSVPWNFKFAAAFLSDTLPICGRRRIPYLAGGVIAQCSAYWLVGVSAPAGETGIWAWIPQSNILYALLTLLMAVGAMFTGVMCDTVVVETVSV